MIIQFGYTLDKKLTVDMPIISPSDYEFLTAKEEKEIEDFHKGIKNSRMRKYLNIAVGLLGIGVGFVALAFVIAKFIRLVEYFM